LIPSEGTLRCDQDLIFATEIGKVALTLIPLRSLACSANDYAIAGVGRLYLCVDVAPVVARGPAAGTVEGIAVVDVEEVIARETINSVLVVGVGIRVDGDLR
jgi:hypothetical protein